MSKKIDIKAMMSLQTGSKIICVSEQSPKRGTKYGSVYVFEGYDDSTIPKNRQNAVMTWYPDKPIWTPEEYENIRYQFMSIRLEGVEGHQWLKDFNIL